MFVLSVTIMYINVSTKTQLMHTELHWLDVPEQVQYKLGVLMYSCQHNQAPRYLTNHCTPVSDTVFFRQRLHSASSHQHATALALTAVGLFLLLVRRWTHCPKTCRIRSVLWTVTDSHWRHFYFRGTSVFSTLQVLLRECELYKFTFDIDIDNSS